MTDQRTPATTPRPKFEFADGLRAIAAISVALYHTTTFTGHLGDIKADLPAVWRLAQIGNYAVPVFIVLSGFVLMLPVARTPDLVLRGGFRSYITRRAKRILPPYYASLIIFLALIWLVPVMQTRSDTAWDSKIPVTVEGVISHLLVLHNLSPDWIYQINGPAWSIATEWQIYFLMPLLLIVWRRLGGWWTVVIAVAAGLAIGRFLPAVSSAHFWFIGLFAMGMLAAYLTVNMTKLRLGWPALIVGGAALAWLFISPTSAESKSLLSETLAGAAIALTLVWLGTASMRGQKTWLHRILETRFLVWVGLWSYSLYLIHSPLLGLSNLLLLSLDLPTWAQLLIMVGAAFPLAAASAYLFHRLVERRFITSHQKAELSTNARKAPRSSR